MNRLIIIFITLIISIGCNGDYDKDLGDNYHLVKTNACCIFIFNKKVEATKVGNVTYYDNRIIKPMVQKIWYNNQVIIGYKVKNECCFLADYEVENPDGYFIVNKKTQKIIDGLDKTTFLSTLKKYHVNIKTLIFDGFFSRP